MLAVLLTFRGRLARVNGTDLGAGPAFSAEGRVYYIRLAFGYSPFGALGQAGSAGNAFFCYVICHLNLLI